MPSIGTHTDAVIARPPALDPHESRPGGLTSAEATTRLAQQGRNELQREEATPRWRILGRQRFGNAVSILRVLR